MRLLTLARDLSRRKARERDHLFVAEGMRSVAELLNSTVEVVGMLSGPQLAATERGRELRDAASQRGIHCSEVSDREFASAAGTESPQGVLAIGTIPDRSIATLERRAGLRILILDAVQDPGNVGTILRTAAALGADATIALPGTVNLWNAKVVRAAMGALYHHHALHSTWDAVNSFLQSESVALWVAEGQGESIAALEAPPKLALVVGNEGAGVSEPVRARADRRVSIPLAPDTESLNVAVATGILLFQLRF